MKILSTVGLKPEQRRLIEQAAGDTELIDRPCRSQADMVQAAEGGCDILFTLRVPDELMNRSPQLKWVQLLSAGADHILKGVLERRKEVAVTTGSGVAASTIAEYSIASMLAWAHSLHITIRSQLQHEWKRTGFMDIEPVRGKTLGVIGYGSIGRETARIGRALGMDVLALKRNPEERRDFGWNPAGVGDPEGVIPSRWYGAEQCKELLRESDYVTVTLPLTPATRGFVGGQEIAAMRPNAYIVNVGRGEVIDQKALIEALRENRIGGAGLDVFEREPLETESRLWDQENVILTPHISGGFKNYNGVCCELFAANLQRFRNGHPLFNLVDRSLGY
jgi:phosphoglycerate dehydrogenase-like enzyme